MELKERQAKLEKIIEQLKLEACFHLFSEDSDAETNEAFREAEEATKQLLKKIEKQIEKHLFPSA